MKNEKLNGDYDSRNEAACRWYQGDRFGVEFPCANAILVAIRYILAALSIVRDFRFVHDNFFGLSVEIDV